MPLSLCLCHSLCLGCIACFKESCFSLGGLTCQDQGEAASTCTSPSPILPFPTPSKDLIFHGVHIWPCHSCQHTVGTYSSTSLLFLTSPERALMIGSAYLTISLLRCELSLVAQCLFAKWPRGLTREGRWSPAFRGRQGEGSLCQSWGREYRGETWQVGYRGGWEGTELAWGWWHLAISGGTDLPSCLHPHPALCQESAHPVQVSTMVGRHTLSAHGLGDSLFLDSVAQDPSGEGPSLPPSSWWLEMCDHLIWHLHMAPRSLCMSGGYLSPVPSKVLEMGGVRGGGSQDISASSTCHDPDSPLILFRGALQPVGCLGAQSLGTHYIA